MPLRGLCSGKRGARGGRAHGEEGLDAVDHVHAEHLRVYREGHTRHCVHAVEREVAQERQARRGGCNEAGGRGAAQGGGGGLGLVALVQLGGFVFDLPGDEGGFGGVEAAGDGHLPDEEDGSGEGGEAGSGLEDIDERGLARLARRKGVADFVDDDGDAKSQKGCETKIVLFGLTIHVQWEGWFSNGSAPKTVMIFWCHKIRPSSSRSWKRSAEIVHVKLSS